MTPLERYRATLAGKATDQLCCHPITMMFSARQLGRPFREFVMDHRVMVEAQLHMVEALGVDVLQTISDPCREVHDLGGACIYFDNEAPANDSANALLKDKSRLASLKPPDPLGGGRMHDRVKGVAAMREQVGDSMSVQGWVEGPMAMAVDLRGMQSLMLDTVLDPAFVDDVFAFSIEMEIAFAKAQVEAGADTIGIGDAAASLINPEAYHTMVFKHEKRLVDAIHAMGAIVRLHICGNTTHLVEDFERLGCDMIDIDHLADLRRVREAVPETPLLGNMDPTQYLLQGTPEKVYDKLAECHAIVGPRFLVGAGCEAPPHTPVENFRAMVQYARDHRVPGP